MYDETHPEVIYAIAHHKFWIKNQLTWENIHYITIEPTCHLKYLTYYVDDIKMLYQLFTATLHFNSPVIDKQNINIWLPVIEEIIK